MGVDVLLVIALLGGASLALGALYLQQSLAWQRATVRARLGIGGPGASGANGALLRPAPHVPPLGRLLISEERRVRLKLELERAGWATGVGRYLALRATCALAGALVGVFILSRLGAAPLAIAPRVLLVALLAAAGWVLVGRYVKHRQARRLDQIIRQLPDVLTTVSKSLRAGGGVMQGLGSAATETPAPLGPILQSGLRDVQLGADLEDAFGVLAQRVGSPDLEIALTAIAIQRRTGGSLSEMLGNVTETLRERQQLEGDIRVLTTQQHMSAYVAAALPIGVAAVFLFLQPEIATLLFTTAIGLTALGIGVAFEVAGIWLIRELGRIEV